MSLEVKQGNNWFPVQTDKAAVFQLNQPRPGAPESGSWSITIADNYNVAFEYRVQAVLYKQKPNGTRNLNPVKLSGWAAVPR